MTNPTDSQQHITPSPARHAAVRTEGCSCPPWYVKFLLYLYIRSTGFTTFAARNSEKKEKEHKIMATVWVWLASFHWDTSNLGHLSWINHTELMGRNNNKLSAWRSHPVNSNTANWFLLQMKSVLTDHEYSSSCTLILLVLWMIRKLGRCWSGWWNLKEMVKHLHQFSIVQTSL